MELKTRRRTRSRVRKRVIFALVSFFVIILVLGFVSLSKYFTIFTSGNSTHSIHLKATPQKRINILLLGVGGGTHDGPDLTDTIIFASVDPEKKKITMVSLPRDLWAPDIGAKVNATYTFAEE